MARRRSMVVALLLLAACGGGGAAVTSTTAAVITTVVPTTTAEAGFEVTSEDGAVTVHVPASAMTEDPGITITRLEKAESSPGLGAVADHPTVRVYDLGPDGIEFCKQAPLALGPCQRPRIDNKGAHTQRLELAGNEQTSFQILHRRGFGSGDGHDEGGRALQRFDPVRLRKSIGQLPPGEKSDIFIQEHFDKPECLDPHQDHRYKNNGDATCRHASLQRSEKGPYAREEGGNVTDSRWFHMRPDRGNDKSDEIGERYHAEKHDPRHHDRLFRRPKRVLVRECEPGRNKGVERCQYEIRNARRAQRMPPL